jgi:TolB-like protein/class 3 adenylate cyclase
MGIAGHRPAILLYNQFNFSKLWGFVLSGEHVERRLAAILAADVAGYSRLMGDDEEGTLAQLKFIRKTLVDPAIASHRGRIVKTTGDGMLVEFASAVDAVRSAVEVQRGMAEQNAAVPQDQRIEFRIGIHVGDIIIDDNDIFGDGVNIAARLEGISEPGGVCISDDAQRQIRAKIDSAFDDMGPQTLKNIAEPMSSWRLQIDKHSSSMTTKKDSIEIAKPLALPDKPSIAVLPFQNMSGDPEQEYFADGMVEDIITALSRFKSLFVIARNSSFTYKGKAVDIRQVGRELGVRYVLEGGVRKAAGRVRITGQLIEVATNNHLWADKFDGDLGDVFELQDKITTSVVGSIAPKLEQAEIERAKRKPTERLDSYDFFLRGMALSYRRSFAEACASFKEAFARDPEYAAAYAMAALMLMAPHAHEGSPLPLEKRADAIRWAQLAARLGTEDALALARSAQVLSYVGHEYEQAEAMIEQAVVLNPNLAVVWFCDGFVSLNCGVAKRALESFNRVLRLSPLDPLRGTTWYGIALAHWGLGSYNEGCAAATKAIQAWPETNSLGAFIVNAVAAGRHDEAREALERLLRLRPNLHVSHVSEMFPTRNAEWGNKIVAAFREAGLPE